VQSLGATEAFDYNDPDAASKIRSLTNNTLRLAWDTISEESSAKFCADALSSDKGGRYGSILPVKCPRDDVESVSTLMYTVFGEEFEFAGNKVPASKEDFEFAREFMAITERLLAEGKLKPHAEKVGEGGLEGVLKGLDDLKTGKVSGSKLVYRVDETP